MNSNILDTKSEGESQKPNTADRNMCKDNQICQLNDDCLLHIFKYLSLRDIFNFARTCDQFRNVFKLCARFKDEELELHDQRFGSLSASEQQDFIALVGCNIRTLKICMHIGDSTIFELIGKSCPNLRTLVLVSTYQSVDLNQMVDNMQMITELELRNINDNDILIFAKLAQLKKLTLQLQFEFTGEHLNQMKTIQHLSLNYCPGLEPIHLIEMFKALVDLHTFEFENCDTITSDVWHAMVENAKKLEYMSIELNEGFEIIARLPMLKCLEIKYYRYEYVTHMLQELADKSNQLEVLKISKHILLTYSNFGGGMIVCRQDPEILDKWFYYLSKMVNLIRLEWIGNCEAIDDSLLQLLANCKRLNYVNIVSLVPSVTPETFFPKVIALIRSSMEKRVLPVTFDSRQFGSIATNAELDKAVEDGIIRICSPIDEDRSKTDNDEIADKSNNAETYSETSSDDYYSEDDFEMEFDYQFDSDIEPSELSD